MFRKYVSHRTPDSKNADDQCTVRIKSQPSVHKRVNLFQKKRKIWKKLAKKCTLALTEKQAALKIAHW